MNSIEKIFRGWCPVFSDGEGDGDGTTGDGTTGDGTTGDGGGDGDGDGDGDGQYNGNRSLTQKEVNTILAREKRKQQLQTQKALDELQALKKKANITAKERGELDTRIDTLQNELLTKEELAKKSANQLRKQHQQELENLTTERELWRQRYTESTIVRTITDAAIESKAFSAQQIVAIMRPKTQLIEALDDNGDPTGEYEAKVEVHDTDDRGKPVKLMLPVTEAVKKLREMEEHQNLFHGAGTGGLGNQNRRNGKEKTLADAAKAGSKAYREMRKKQGLKGDQ